MRPGHDGRNRWRSNDSIRHTAPGEAAVNNWRSDMAKKKSKGKGKKNPMPAY